MAYITSTQRTVADPFAYCVDDSGSSSRQVHVVVVVVVKIKTLKAAITVSYPSENNIYTLQKAKALCKTRGLDDRLQKK